MALREPGASPIAGGTDLVLLIKDGLFQPQKLVDLSQLNELQGISEKEDFIEIGASTKLKEIMDCEILPECLRKGAGWVGSPQIRNLGTIGGNICNASPSGDTLTPLLVLEAELVLQSWRGTRVVPLDSFFTGPKKTIRADDEILTVIRLPKRVLQKKTGFSKIGGRNGMIISQVNGALSCFKREFIITEVRMAFGSVAPTPIRAKHTEEALEGSDIRNIPESVFSAVQEDIKPISDIRAGDKYRRALMRAIILDILSQVQNP